MLLWNIVYVINYRLPNTLYFRFPRLNIWNLLLRLLTFALVDTFVLEFTY